MDRPVDALLANAGIGLGRAFLDQDFDDVQRVINTNVTGTVVGSTGHCNTALSLSAGVSNPKVFLGRWFKRNATLFKYD